MYAYQDCFPTRKRKKKTTLFHPSPSPLVELVDHLEVHVGSAEHVLVHQVEGGVRDELAEVPVVVLPLDVLPRGRELHLKERVVPVADDHEVVVPRHGASSSNAHVANAMPNNHFLATNLL